MKLNIEKVEFLIFCTQQSDFFKKLNVCKIAELISVEIFKPNSDLAFSIEGI